MVHRAVQETFIRKTVDHLSLDAPLLRENPPGHAVVHKRAEYRQQRAQREAVKLPKDARFRALNGEKAGRRIVVPIERTLLGEEPGQPLRRPLGETRSPNLRGPG